MRGSEVSPVCLMCCGLFGLFAGCANYVAPAPTSVPTPMIGRLTGGVVIAVRPIDATQDDALTNSILSALGQDQITVSAVHEEEIVILRADQTATSIVEPIRSTSSDYVPGQKIAIVEAAATMIHPE